MVAEEERRGIRTNGEDDVPSWATNGSRWAHYFDRCGFWKNATEQFRILGHSSLHCTGVILGFVLLLYQSSLIRIIRYFSRFEA